MSSTTLRRRAVGRGLLWSGLGAACAAGYLIPYKAATTAVGAEGLVLPMLIAAALLNSILDGVNRIRSTDTPPWRFTRVTLVAALILGVASALGNEAVCRALETINPGLTSVILRTQVIFVAFGGLFLLREPVGLRFWIGVALALAGYALLQGALGQQFSLAGVLWATVAAASFGSMQVTIRRTIGQIDPLQVNTLRLFLAAALVALLPGRVQALFNIDGRIWLLAATAALCGPVISRLCLMRALRHLPAAHATLALFLAPVFAYVLAGFVFGAWPGALELLGSLVILIAVALPITELMRRDTTLHPPTDG